MARIDPNDPNARLDRRELVSPPDLSLRIDSNWHAIVARHAPGRRSSRVWTGRLAFATFSLAAAATAVVMLGPGLGSWLRPQVSPVAGTVLESGGEPSRLALADGSVVECAPHSAVELTSDRGDEVLMHVRRGQALFDVAHNPRRRFLVRAGQVEVQVVGTRFSVMRGDGEGSSTVEVAVERGIVKITSGSQTGGQQKLLRAGERWSVSEQLMGRQAKPPVEIEPPAAVEDPVEAPPVEMDVEPTPDLDWEASNQQERATPRRRRIPAARNLTPMGLFEKAAAARVEGHHEDAAGLYEDFLRRYPGDRRASLVALELGRTRMDVMNDPRGAIQALRYSLRLAPISPFKEDVLARLTGLYERVGRREDCERTRQIYLGEFPKGRHAPDIAQRCQ